MRAAAVLVGCAVVACTVAFSSASVVGDATFVAGPFIDNVAGLEANFTPPTPHFVIPSQSVTISTWFGAYPCLGCGGTRQSFWCNGGLPQLANLTLHKSIIKRDLDAMKIPLNYTGTLINDYEAWHLGWDYSNALYHNASILLARKRHPHLAGNATAIEAIAQEEFEHGAVDFFIATMEGMREARPQLGGIGFYNYPASYTYWGSASKGSALNDKLHALWNLTTVFAPSIYLPYMSGVDIAFSRNLQYVDQQIDEADRVRRTLAPSVAAKIKIAPYTWYRYHPGEPHAYDLLTSQDACLEFTSLFAGNKSRVDAAIIWGDEGRNVTAQDDVKNWMAANAEWLGGQSLPTTLDCATKGAPPAAPLRDGEPLRKSLAGGSPAFEIPLDSTDDVIPPYTRCSL